MDAVLKNAQPARELTSSDANNQFQLRLAAVATTGRSRGGREYVTARRPLRVLVVDSDRDATDALAMLVRLWGHDARCAYDGAAGLAMASADLPDVVLLDIALPKMNGYELAAKLRQGAGLKDCLLIAVTGFTDEESRRRCQEGGIDLFLIKPVDVLVMETLLTLERQRLGLSGAVSITIDAESKKYRAAQEAVLV